MLNIEKYKDEIKENGGIVEIFKKYSPIGQTICGYEDFYGDCIDWFCEEYKEPILTDEEREYLKVVCEPFHERINYVARIEGAGGKKLIIYYDDCYVMYLPSIELTFMNVELKKEYTLEELGIEYGD